MKSDNFLSLSHQAEGNKGQSYRRCCGESNENEKEEQFWLHQFG